MQQTKMRVLDGFRGAAMLCILFVHGAILPTSNPIDWSFHCGAVSLWFGMHAFFVLSGFLIAGILVDAKGAPQYYRNFYARRTLRIIPLYYLVLAFFFFVFPHLEVSKLFNWSPTPTEQSPYWFFYSNYTLSKIGGLSNVFGVTWSLAVEEQFYLVMPLLIARCSVPQAMRACFVLFCLAYCFRLVLIAFEAPPVFNYALTFARMDSLAAGAYVALLLRSGLSLGPMVSWAKGFFIAMSAASLVLLVAIEGNAMSLLGQSLSHSLLSLTSAALLFLLATGHAGAALNRFFTNPLLLVLGKYSYGIYLIHVATKAGIQELLYGPSQFLTIAGSKIPGQVIFFAIYISLSTLAAALTYHLFEEPILNLKRFFPLQNQTPPKQESPSTEDIRLSA